MWVITTRGIKKINVISGWEAIKQKMRYGVFFILKINECGISNTGTVNNFIILKLGSRGNLPGLNFYHGAIL